ncbi:arginine--tRNA ligase, chloroplastic/mitochondrial [Tanacetum coccineum]
MWFMCGFKEENADWIVYVTPVRQQEYIEMCFTTPTDRKWKCIQDGTSYVGYRTCNIGPKELASFLDEVDHCCSVVAQGEDAHCLGYTFLKHNRLANCAFRFVEMVGEEGNTFVYLLKARAKILTITLDYQEDVVKLIKGS